MATPSPDRDSGDPSRRASVREFDGKVWDLVENLAHPAFLFGVAHVAMWSAYETSASFREPALGFWTRSGIHAAQFFGAWAVLYGTFLRDMGVPIRATTFIVWSGIVGAITAWMWPARTTPEAADGLWVLLWIQLAVCVVGWLHTYRIWRRAKAAHEAAHPPEELP